jgi:LytS/YehU family sensor histidine kinase
MKRRWIGVYLLTTLYVALSVFLVETWLNDAVYLIYTSKIRELYGKIDINPLLQIFTSVFSLVILMFSSSAVVLFRRWTIHDARVHDLERMAMQSELERLKKQVNPQFLIRLLDKSNAMSLKGNRLEAAAILLELGNILRYQLYDSGRQMVLLGSEIRFLTTILSLEQKCRTGFSFTVESDRSLNNLLIPPLLFLPFIEKIFSTNEEAPFVSLRFLFKNDALVFECQSDVSTPCYADTELDAIRHRLTLLYETDYSLNISNEHSTQIICLNILNLTKHITSDAS